MLSEKIRNLLSTWMAGYARGLVDECADEAAKLERVARAAKILEADYHCFDNSLPDVWDELEAALADLGALGG